MKVALVHDFLVKLGGAERVLKVFSDLFPEAPIYTLFYDEKTVGSVFPKERVITSSLQNLRNYRRLFFNRLPAEIEKFDFSNYDLVISSSTAYAHGIITNRNTRHICYCHSPMRYIWDWHHEYLREQKFNRLILGIVRYLLHKVRIWDKVASDRPDLYIANSEHVKKRISKYYRLPATVIYPPVDVEKFTVKKNHQDFFLIVSTLSPYKKIDLAIRFFNKIKKKLVIIGEGSQRAYLQRLAGETIEFLGYKDDEVVKDYLENCRAVIFPGEDDFGIVPVEAMACGKPVLAYGRGGALETVVAGKTGEFFYEPTLEAMEDAFGRLINNEHKYDPETMRKQADKFSLERFIREFQLVLKS